MKKKKDLLFVTSLLVVSSLLTISSQINAQRQDTTAYGVATPDALIQLNMCDAANTFGSLLNDTLLKAKFDATGNLPSYTLSSLASVYSKNTVSGDSNAIRIGSSSATGAFTIAFSSALFSRVLVTAHAWNTDGGKLQVNGVTQADDFIYPTANYSTSSEYQLLTFDNLNTSTFTFSTTVKRVWISRIEFYVGDGGSTSSSEEPSSSEVSSSSTTSITSSSSSTPSSIDWSTVTFYSSLTSSSNEIYDLAHLLRNTINYVSYGDARYVYSKYDNDSQVVMYDIPGSTSYRKVTATGLDGWGDGGVVTGDGFSITLNREHVWACSDMRIMPSNSDRTLDGYVNFVENDGSFDYRPDNTNRGHFSDLHNLWNALASPNGSHSDHFFGDENGSSVGPYLANSIFYPGDEYRGDVARILFYMTLMYPYLTLVNRDSLETEGSIYYGYLDILLRWNTEDPVSYYETERNNTIYAQQGNRNPFVDFYSQNIASYIFASGDPNVL